MRAIRYASPEQYWRVAEPVVLADPVTYSVLASSMDAIRFDPAAHRRSAFYAVERAGLEPVLGLFDPPHPFLVPAADPAAALLLAGAAHASALDLWSLSGAPESVDAFAERWCLLTGRTQQAMMRLGVYELSSSPRLSRPVPGHAEVAGQRHAGLVEAWLDSFSGEVGLPHSPPALALGDGRVWLWCDPEPVAVAISTPPAGGVSRIGYVYTPPERRGHGYGSAVTAAISADRLSRGLRCLLFADLGNHTSTEIYQRLGYRKCGESLNIAFGG